MLEFQNYSTNFDSFGMVFFSFIYKINGSCRNL